MIRDWRRKTMDITPEERPFLGGNKQRTTKTTLPVKSSQILGFCGVSDSFYKKTCGKILQNKQDKLSLCNFHAK